MKQTILNAVFQALENELERQARANVQSNACAAFSAAGAEKQRDTTGIEAAFLAKGYANHVQQLQRQLDELKALPIEDFTDQEIDIGAVVEVELDGDADLYMLLNCGGGTEVEVDGRTITVITPKSPLGSKLMGNIEAGYVELPSGLEGIILDVY
jgi:transcription elongation GreA/GreB family factor